MDLGYFGDGAQLAADLVNTRGWVSGTERLTSVEDVRAFLDAHDQTRRVTKADVPKLLGLRDRLREIFLAGDDDLARSRINALLTAFPTLPQLAGDEPGVTFESTGTDADVVDRRAGCPRISVLHRTARDEPARNLSCLRLRGRLRRRIEEQ